LLTDLTIIDLYSADGDSGGPVYFYSENLNSVSLNGILIASIISTNYSNDITAILPLDIILSQVKIKPILSL
ncbi:813_t:CDS:1, partial [Gigaspora rosea]